MDKGWWFMYINMKDYGLIGINKIKDIWVI